MGREDSRSSGGGGGMVTATQLERPAVGSVHHIVWHPVNGDIARSIVMARVVAISEQFAYVQPGGMGVLQVTWGEWSRMVGQVSQ